MTQAIADVSFHGNCANAMRFDEKARRGKLFGGDFPANLHHEGIKGASITVDYATIAEAEQVVAALAEGGQVTMPVQAAFWAKRWGMLVDKFGRLWIVNGEPIAFGT